MNNQTGVIFFGLLVGFIVFITVRGELELYLRVFGLAGGVDSNSANNAYWQSIEGIRRTAGVLNDTLPPLGTRR